jgi:ferredoxin-NADP reductase
LVLGALFGFGGGVWWVASSFLFVPIIIGGLLVAEKVKRLDMVAVFLSAAFALHIISMWQQSIPTSELITTFFVSYPFVFLGFFMLTEPFTMPSQKQARYVYAVVVASATILPSLGPIGMSPELALVIGNLVLAPWGQRQKLILALSSMRPVTSSVYEFSFPKPKDFTFIAGQYVEWMVPHQSSDNRGTRRYFTIVSAPEDDELRLAFKFPEKASTYKQAMMKLKPGDIVVASQRSGDFVLPTAMDSKLGFIAGGIGVTPFVSHVTSMARRGEKRDVATIYCTATESDLAYASLLSAAGQLIPVIGSGAVPEGAESGYLTTDIIMRRVPDYASRTWYISGPPKMVDSAYGILRGLKVPVGQIKRDFFPGLA